MDDVAALIEKLRNGNVAIRDEATEALIACGAPAVPGLIEALHDPSFLVQMRVARVLGAIGDPRSVRPLITVLHQTRLQWDSDVACAVAEALGEFALRNPIPELRAALPLLRRLPGMDLLTLPGVVRIAIERIDTATAARKDLPLPAEPEAEPSPQSLPLPAAPLAPPAEELPIPSVPADANRETAHSFRPRWWQRLRHLVWPP